ncbi:hypothetical protein E4U19_001906 [Claviceps sp. Clav32 group G5]|nr:hypothetical protein E4U19_001906 [Claviceps sp. Clav32 group G5]
MASPPVDPVLRNTIRYTVSAREYAALHKCILSRSRTLRRAAPTPAAVDKALQPRRDAGHDKSNSNSNNTSTSTSNGDDYNARAIRHALRVFLVSLAGSKAWDVVARKLAGNSAAGDGSRKSSTSWPAVRLSASLSATVLLYRLLFRFLWRLRAQLLDTQAAPFRKRNPRIGAALTSRYAPAVGASLAGVALGACPTRHSRGLLRGTIALFALVRALEFTWNVCEAQGLIWRRRGGRPWWFGSWLLQPLATGQLLHAVVFDRDCFPDAYGRFIFSHSGGYLPTSAGSSSSSSSSSSSRGSSPPSAAAAATAVVDALAHMARLSWPAYVSPTMFPHYYQHHTWESMPAALQAVAPLTAQAHPLITSLACATLHPEDPSCARTLLTFWLRALPPLARFFLGVYAVLTLVVPPRLAALYHRPVAVLSAMLSRAFRTALFATGAISTAWASICFFQNYLPRRVLPTQRFFLGGFAAGLWACVMDSRHGRPIFLSSARLSLLSLWRVGIKRRWWRAVRGGDVGVFVLALALTGVAYERDARAAVPERQWRKGITWLRGEGWRDWAGDEESVEEEAQKSE